MLYLYTWLLEPFQARRFHLYCIRFLASPGAYSCLPCRLRRRVLSTQSFRVMEKKAMPTATLRMYQTTCVRVFGAEWRGLPENND